MDRYDVFDDSALRARLKGLRKTKLDLQERTRARAARAESEGRWVPSDPMYQSLSFVLRGVSNDLRATEREHRKRMQMSTTENPPKV